MADNNCDSSNDSSSKTSNFICGVVEGFYGRPWTTEQRKDLFQKLKKWGMNSYLYAPKDDYKHRAYWRDLYTVEEAEHLTGLITAAKENAVTFYYALSPGLDITYSNPKDIAALKRKLEQVSQFGCPAFALLFDDIEPEMSEADKEVFQSFAHAQVSVTNEIFQHLNQPKFLICPTQYCSARATPNVQNSEYLNTLGSKLAPEVDIMWTGQKVISRLLTKESIEEITEVLKRPPVIWDNIHANDYDQKRIFLGPYQGRSPEIIKKLRGVLTNPNCEYGANFIAIHTLAQWSRCSVDGTPDLVFHESVSADIKLETETEDGISEDIPPTLPENIYHPRRALRNAILDWLPEFKRHKQAWGPISKPQPVVTMAIPIPVPIIPSINTCMSLTTTTQATTTVCSTIAAPSIHSDNSISVSSSAENGNQLHALAEACNTITCNSSLLQPVATGAPVILNSLASEVKVISEPMECNVTPVDSPVHTKSNNSPDVPMAENLSSADLQSNNNSSMQVETPSPSNTMIVDSAQNDVFPEKENDRDLQYEDLLLLCDLFYLPFEHGAQGLQILQEFNWLKSNSHLVAQQNLRKHTRATSGEDSPEVQEWRERAKKLDEIYEAVNKLHERLSFSNNRELLYDLYPYVWDMRGVISLLNSYVKWLARGHFTQAIGSYTLGNYTWFSKGWKESFMSGEQEPWVFRGGLTADLQRLIPVDSGSDLFVYKAPETPISKVYTIRPYLAEDELSVYNVCRKTCLDGSDGTEMFSEYPNLAPERLVGGFLSLSPELCFVVEEGNEIVGYALGALNAKQFYQKLKAAWIPEMCNKYPEKLDPIDESNVSIPQEMIRWFHSFKGEDIFPEAIQNQHPSVMCATLLNSVFDQSIAKRVIICLLAALRANGSFGVYVPVSAEDRYFIEFYSKLGFIEICHGFSSEMVYLGRIF
ncbi:hypothetical protein V9T40_003029 [Parthenolecanium corni]|uniref:protein O-GlcNAcase n=1 Tax=Parthenolecanium corni TaxID=536013 RepID=A0AAN9TPW5_9HEMI